MAVSPHGTSTIESPVGKVTRTGVSSGSHINCKNSGHVKLLYIYIYMHINKIIKHDVIYI